MPAPEAVAAVHYGFVAAVWPAEVGPAEVGPAEVCPAEVEPSGGMSRRRRTGTARLQDPPARRPRPHHRVAPDQGGGNRRGQHGKGHHPRTDQARPRALRWRRGAEPVHRGHHRRRGRRRGTDAAIRRRGFGNAGRHRRIGRRHCRLRRGRLRRGRLLRGRLFRARLLRGHRVLGRVDRQPRVVAARAADLLPGVRRDAGTSYVASQRGQAMRMESWCQSRAT